MIVTGMLKRIKARAEATTVRARTAGRLRMRDTFPYNARQGPTPTASGQDGALRVLDYRGSPAVVVALERAGDAFHLVAHLGDARAGRNGNDDGLRHPA